MAKKKKTLQQRLQEPIAAAETGPSALQLRQQLSIALGQRDSALAALNRRANVGKLFAAHDEALLRLEQSLGILKQLSGDVGERCHRLTRALGNEDAEGGQ